MRCDTAHVFISETTNSEKKVITKYAQRRPLGSLPTQDLCRYTFWKKDNNAKPLAVTV